MTERCFSGFCTSEAGSAGLGSTTFTFFFGAGSTGVYYGVHELVVDVLRSRIHSGGVQDDIDFWRWSSQIARGVADLHRDGIIHLALQVRDEWVASRTQLMN